MKKNVNRFGLLVFGSVILASWVLQTCPTNSALAQATTVIPDPLGSSPNDEIQASKSESANGPEGTVENSVGIVESRECRCHCFPCQCPLPEAACIECPRVSTLNPNYNLNFFGAVVGDMLFNEARAISPGAPYYLSPASPRGLTQTSVDIHARSSYLAAALTGPKMGEFQAGGLAMVFFYNDNALADQYGILPGQIYGDLTNEKWRFAAGLQFDVFNPIAPNMLAFSALAGSGNAGNAWRGQFRVERFMTPTETRQWTIQAALSEPIASTIDPAFQFVSEDNGWPNVEGRIALGLGCLGDGPGGKRPFEIGLSGVVGEIRSSPLLGPRVESDVWGTAIDCRWQLSPRFGVQGEFYTGKALGTYNGGILQNVNASTFEGIQTSGGWIETYVYWTPCLHSHLGYGIDDPENNDLSNNPANFQRELNETTFANLIWDVNQSLKVGMEATYRKTDNTSVLDNKGAGIHTQVSWIF
jgi:hypothetical protein